MDDIQIIETKIISQNKWMSSVTKNGIEHAFFIGETNEEAYSYAEMYIHFYMVENYPQEYSKELQHVYCEKCHAMFEEECACELNDDDDE